MSDFSIPKGLKSNRRCYMRLQHPFPGADEWWPSCFLGVKSAFNKVSTSGLARALHLSIEKVAKVHERVAKRENVSLHKSSMDVHGAILFSHLPMVLRELNLSWTEVEIDAAVDQFCLANAYKRNGGGHSTFRRIMNVQENDDEDDDDDNDDDGNDEKATTKASKSSRAPNYTFPLVPPPPRPIFQFSSSTYPAIMQACMDRRIADLKEWARKTMPDTDLQPVLEPLVEKRKRELWQERKPIIEADEELRIRSELEKEILDQRREKVAKTAALRRPTDAAEMFTISLTTDAEKAKKMEELIKK